MYIACPECESKFVVTPEQIGENGRKVRCSECLHIWHQDPVLTEEIPEYEEAKSQAAPAFGNGVNLPALLPDKSSPFAVLTPAIMLSFIIFMLITIFPSKVGLDKMLSYEHLKVEDVQIHRPQDSDKITIRYKIHNSSNKSTNVPYARIRFLDKDKKVIKSFIYDYSKVRMLPGQLLQVKTEIASPAKEADNLEVMLGNRVDFILRGD